jgi:hypothetical protein
MKLDVRRGLHRLRNECDQWSRIAENCAVLIADLDAAIEATRLCVPRRSSRRRSFQLDATRYRRRRMSLERMNEKSEERRIEQRLYLAYGPNGALRSTDVWDRLLAYQVPLFEARKKDTWGHVDLLGSTSDGRPVVVELKRHSSPETPLRAVVEGLANAIAVEANWLALAEEIRSATPCTPSEAGAPAEVVVLAPEDYWQSWLTGSATKRKARDEMLRLSNVLAAAGYPISFATFDWPFEDDPRVRRLGALAGASAAHSSS